MDMRNLYEFRLLFSSPIFMATLWSWLSAQLLKVFFNLVRHPNRSPKRLFETFLWSTGGMPSSHSSAVVGLSLSIGLNDGFASPLFVSMLLFAMIVIRDALGVRRSSGKQASALNQLGRQLEEKVGIPFQPVKEVHGHTPPEVGVGALLGVVMAVFFFSL